MWTGTTPSVHVNKIPLPVHVQKDGHETILIIMESSSVYYSKYGLALQGKTQRLKDAYERRGAVIHRI